MAATVGVGALSVTVGPTFTVTVMSFVWALVVLPLPPVVPIPAVAVTFAVLLVDRIVVATPLPSLDAFDGLTAPVSTVNATGTPGRRLPLVSTMVAEIVDDPPLAGNV